MRRKVSFYLLAVLSFCCWYPVVFIFFGSLTSETELAENLSTIINNVSGEYSDWNVVPDNWTLASYKQLFLLEPGFFVLFWNSMKIASGVLIGQFLIAVPAAWGFARYKFMGRRILFFLYIIFMMLPFQIMMLPEYLILGKLNLLNRLLSIILPGTFSTFPIFIMYNFFCGIPDSILDAARLDGASELQIFLHIGIPAGFSGITASMILQFLEYWNLIEQPMLFLDRQDKWPLSLYLPNIEISNAGIAFASSFVALIPSFLIFRMGQSYLEKGIAATAVKR